MNHYTRNFPQRAFYLPFCNWANNETFGQTAEQAISNWSNIESGIAPKRVDPVLLTPMEKIIKYALESSFTITEAIGTDNTDVDFKGVGPMGSGTISVKTNIKGCKVCPQNIGQTTPEKLINHFSIPVLNDDSLQTAIKRYILTNTCSMMNEYLNHLNACDYLIHIHLEKKTAVPNVGGLAGSKEITENYLSLFPEIKLSTATLEVKYISWYHRSFFENFHFDHQKFTFSKNTVEAWNESSSVKYNNVSIGEFQIHNKRKCVKFRFNFKNLIDIIISQQIKAV